MSWVVGNELARQPQHGGWSNVHPVLLVHSITGSTGLQNNVSAGEGQGIRILELPSRPGDLSN